MNSNQRWVAGFLLIAAAIAISSLSLIFSLTSLTDMVLVGLGFAVFWFSGFLLLFSSDAKSKEEQNGNQ